ncbi:hypothetical protein [Streptomyces flaveolus]|uniref:hypothetical protein n=1 Tax=Streptomyces flaveolus TaxID=67297 RepID=UPI0033D613DC
MLSQGVTANPGTKRRAYLKENVAAPALSLDADTLSLRKQAVPADENCTVVLHASFPVLEHSRRPPP